MVPSPTSILSAITQNKLVVALTAAVLAGLLLGGGTMLFQAVGPADTALLVENEVGYDVGMLTGHIEMNKREFLTGWIPDQAGLTSEAMVIQEANVTFEDYEHGLGIRDRVLLSRYQYQWYIDGQLAEDLYDGYGNKLNNPYVVHFGAGDRRADNEFYYFNLITNEPAVYLAGNDYANSHLETRLIVEKIYVADGQISGDPIVFGNFSDWGIIPEIVDQWLMYEDVTLAKWGATLKDGAGYVDASDGTGAPSVVQIGDEITWRLKTGGSAGKGWTCWIEPPTHTGISRIDFTGSGFTGQDDFDGTVSYQVPTTWFKEGADNQAIIHLENGAFEGSITTLFIVDDLTLMPTPGSPYGVIAEVEGTGQTGTEMVFTLNAEPNEISGSPIDYFKVWAYYGSPTTMPGLDFPELYILSNYHARADASGNAVVTFTIPAGYEGQISFKANAIDEAGRASEGDVYSFQAWEEDPTPPPPIIGFDVFIFVLVIIFVAFGLIIVNQIPQIKQYRWIITIAILAAFLYYVSTVWSALWEYIGNVL